MHDEMAPNVKPCNPYRRPIAKFAQDLRGICWEFPYVPQLVEFFVLLIVFAITGVLFLTIGVAAQLASIFQSLLVDAKEQIAIGTLIEKSAYAVAAGIYILLWLPLFLFLLPFIMVGWVWNHLGYWGLAFLVFLLLVICLPYTRNSIINMAHYIAQQKEAISTP